MSDPVDLLRLAVLLYGGIGGWLGIVLAVYLYRIRHDPANPASVLGVFTLGFAMVMATLLISGFPLATHVWLALVAVTYTLMVIAEVALFAANVYPYAFTDIRAYVFDEPRFAHPNERIPRGQTRLQRYQAHRRNRRAQRRDRRGRD